jgi:hypothetical protein
MAVAILYLTAFAVFVAGRSIALTKANIARVKSLAGFFVKSQNSGSRAPPPTPLNTR